MKMLFDSWRRKKPVDAVAEKATSVAPVPASAPAAQPAVGEDIASVTLELGDFLHRIPPGLLKEGAPDPKRPVQVEIAELAQCLTSGRSVTNLERLFRKTPGLFRPDAPPLDGVEIYYPWQKILQLVTQPALGEGPGVSVQHLLAEMKRCVAAKDEPVPTPAKAPPRGAVHRVRGGEREVSWMSVQRDARRPAAAAGETASVAPIRVAVAPELAREIPIRVEAPHASPTILRMPNPSPAPETPQPDAGAEQKSGAPRAGLNSAEGGGATGSASAPELKLVMMPDLALAEEPEVSAAVGAASVQAAAMNIPDLAICDDSAPVPEAPAAMEPSATLELEVEETIHFPAMAGAAEPPLAAVMAERERELAALRETQAEAEKRHQAERAELERKVAEFIAMGDDAVRQRDAEIAAQREQILAEASAREESLKQERVRAEAAAEAACAESIALLEQTKSAAALEMERLRTELEAAKNELLAAQATRDAEKAMAESELAERDHQLAWRDRTLEGLEGDLETYRNRIKAVLKQRDEFAEAKKMLTLQLANQAEAMAALERRVSELASAVEAQV